MDMKPFKHFFGKSCHFQTCQNYEQSRQKLGTRVYTANPNLNPISQFSQGKTFFHYMEPLLSLQGPCFHYRDFPLNPCTVRDCSVQSVSSWYLIVMASIRSLNNFLFPVWSPRTMDTQWKHKSKISEKLVRCAAIPKNLGLLLSFGLCSEGYFLSGRP